MTFVTEGLSCISIPALTLRHCKLGQDDILLLYILSRSPEEDFCLNKCNQHFLYWGISPGALPDQSPCKQSFKQQQPFRGKSLHKCFSGQEPAWRATPRSLPRAAPAAQQPIPSQNLLIFHIQGNLPFSQSLQPGYKLVSSRCQYLPQKGAGSVHVVGIRAWSRGQRCLGVTSTGSLLVMFLRIFQGHFVLCCFLVLFLRKNIPVLQGQGKFAGLLQGLIPHQSVVLDTGTPVFGAVLEASGS